MLQDMVVAHAIMAFVPEMLGSVFVACSDAVCAIVDNKDQQAE